MKIGAQILIDSELTELQLEQLFSGHWGVGYEPEIDDFDGWREALREIVRLCDEYGRGGSSVGR
ncbi:hypothetical protein [Nocardiopsis alba]